MKNEKQNDYCAAWCIHFFRSGGTAFCDFGVVKAETKLGGSCLGRKESAPSSNKNREDKIKKQSVQKIAFKKLLSDPGCRAWCKYFNDGVCTRGEPFYTSIGGSCMGKKTLPSSKDIKWKILNRLLDE